MDLAQRMTRVAIRPWRLLAISMVAAAFVTTACSGSAATPSTASVAASHPSIAPTAAADPSSTISSTAPSFQPSARAEPTPIPDRDVHGDRHEGGRPPVPWDDDCAFKQEGAHITLELASGEWTQSESCKTVPDSVGALGIPTRRRDILVWLTALTGRRRVQPGPSMARSLPAAEGSMLLLVATRVTGRSRARFTHITTVPWLSPASPTGSRPPPARVVLTR